MKKRQLFYLINIMATVCTHSLHAQVGVNTTSPAANLDVRSSGSASILDGILAPRIDADNLKSTYAKEQDGAIVYVIKKATTQTGALVNIDAPGYYYWDNASNVWQKYATSNNTWTLTGNETIDTTLNFLGTKKNNDLLFKVNQTAADANLIDRSKVQESYVSYGTIPSFVYKGEVLRLFSDPWLPNSEYGQMMLGDINIGHGGYARAQFQRGNTNYPTGLSVTNLAIGPNALAVNEGASTFLFQENTAIGYNTLSKSTSSYATTAVGAHALENYTSLANSGGNTAIGAFAASNANPSSCTIIGLSAGQNCDKAAQSIMVGDHAGDYNQGNNNIILGTNSGRTSSGTPASTSSGCILIGTNVGDQLTTGNGNVVIGSIANLTDESNHVIIGTGGDGVPTTAVGLEILRMAAGTVGGVTLSGAPTGVSASIGYHNPTGGDGTGAFNLTTGTSGSPSSTPIANNVLDGTYSFDVYGDTRLNGNLTVTGTGSIPGGVWTSSDERLKTNIKELSYGIDAVMRLHPVIYDKKMTIESTYYKYKNEMGFIAQQIRDVLPNVVSEGKDIDKTLAVNYTELIPVLTKALQEQQVKIKEQDAKIAALAKLVEQLLNKQ